MSEACRTPSACVRRMRKFVNMGKLNMPNATSAPRTGNTCKLATCMRLYTFHGPRAFCMDEVCTVLTTFSSTALAEGKRGAAVLRRSAAMCRCGLALVTG